MIENRKETRTTVKDDVIIFDSENGQTIGKLLNISPNGMGIRGEVKLFPGEEREFILNLKKAIFGVKKIYLSAQCIWCRDNNGEAPYISGFEFVDVTVESANLILGFILEQGSS